MVDSSNVIEIIAILLTALLAFNQWLSSVKRKAREGERVIELSELKKEIKEEFNKDLDIVKAGLLAFHETKKELKKEIKEEFDKEFDDVKVELASFRDVKSKIDLIEARVGDIFTIMSRMADNLDKYVEKIESNIEAKNEKCEKSIRDLYAKKADKK